MSSAINSIQALIEEKFANLERLIEHANKSEEEIREVMKQNFAELEAEVAHMEEKRRKLEDVLASI